MESKDIKRVQCLFSEQMKQRCLNNYGFVSGCETVLRNMNDHTETLGLVMQRALFKMLWLGQIRMQLRDNNRMVGSDDRRAINRRHRFIVTSFLADCYTEDDCNVTVVCVKPPNQQYDHQLLHHKGDHLRPSIHARSSPVFQRHQKANNDPPSHDVRTPHHAPSALIRK